MSTYIGVYGVEAYGTFNEIGVVFEVGTFEEAKEKAVEWYKENAYGRHILEMYLVHNNGNEDLVPYDDYRQAVSDALAGTPDPVDYYNIVRAVDRLIDDETRVDIFTGCGVL